MKNVVLIFVVLLIAMKADAQLLQRRTPNINFGVQVVQPRGEFANQFDGFPAGLSGSLSIPVRRSMLEAGASFAWNNMGSQNENVSVIVGQDQSGTDVYARGTMRIRSNNYRVSGLVRFRPLTGAFQPYADALVGMDQFRTSTDLQVDNSGFSEAGSERIEHRDWSLHAGFALGLRIRLAPLLFLDGRFESIVGSRASYVNQNTIQVVNGDEVRFETSKSNTDKYTYQLGIALQF
jgi:hypothetical protein